MSPTLVAVASFLLCMGLTMASAPVTKTSPDLFSIRRRQWSAPSSAIGRARFWIFVKPGLSVEPLLYQTVEVSDRNHYSVPVVSVLGQEVHVQRFSPGHMQNIFVTVTYEPAPQTSFNLSLVLTLTGSSTDFVYSNFDLLTVPAYTEPLTSYTDTPIMLNVLQVPPPNITPTELRSNSPEFKIRAPAVAYLDIYINNYQLIDIGIQTTQTDAEVTTYGLDVSTLSDEQLVGTYTTYLSTPRTVGSDQYEQIYARVNVHAPYSIPNNPPPPDRFGFSSRTCNHYHGHEQTPTYTWTAGLPNCVCCDLRAEPPSTVSMWKGGQQLTSETLSEGESLLEQEFGPNRRSVCLVVHEASEVSAGFYVCYGQASDGITRRTRFTVAF